MRSSVLKHMKVLKIHRNLFFHCAFGLSSITSKMLKQFWGLGGCTQCNNISLFCYPHQYWELQLLHCYQDCKHSVFCLDITFCFLCLQFSIGLVPIWRIVHDVMQVQMQLVDPSEFTHDGLAMWWIEHSSFWFFFILLC